MADPIQIRAGRRVDGAWVRRTLGECGSMSFIYKTYQRPAGRLVTVQIGTETRDGGSALKLKAIDKGLRELVARGFELPDLTFYCSSANPVPCVAYMGNANGDPVYTVFMGPRTGQHNPQVQAFEGLAGGLGAAGERGIADQVYDGTQRWFGNPKMHAHATTVVIHELGHVLHDLQNEGQFWDYKSLGVEPGGFREHAQTVSHYATKSALEFVAEAFAGVMSGKTYTNDAMTVYRNLGGPVPAVGAFP